MEFLVLVSLLLHISLAIFAELRWHGAGPVLKFIVWLLYVGANYVGTTALGSLSVSRATGEHQLVALWGAFFLLHLGGPDSITAWSVEDNNLSWRDALEALLRVVGAGYVVWTSVSGSWSLVISAWLMLVLSAYKYGEKILALYRANLDNIRSTVEKKRSWWHRTAWTAAVDIATDLDHGPGRSRSTCRKKQRPCCMLTPCSRTFACMPWLMLRMRKKTPLPKKARVVISA